MRHLGEIFCSDSDWKGAPQGKIREIIAVIFSQILWKSTTIKVCVQRSAPLVFQNLHNCYLVLLKSKNLDTQHF